MYRFLLPVIAAALLVAASAADAVEAMPPPAEGAEGTRCLERTKMVDTLINEFGEHLAEVREVGEDGLLEFHVSPEEGTWTALFTDPEWLSCVIAVGKGIDPERIPAIETAHEI